ncbi:MAG: hypothetical protein ACLUIR_02045 [Faecalibacterium prausnitzii]
MASGRKYPEKTVIYHGPYYSPFNKNYNRMCRVFDAFFVGRYRRRGTRFLTKSELPRKFLLENGSPEQVTTARRRRASTRPSGRRADRAGREERPEKGPEAALHRPYRAAPRPLLPAGCAGRGAESDLDAASTSSATGTRRNGTA